ncbi:MAG: efflux RND transporter permease subunit, partial [Paracoccaceae bacterium]
VVGGVTGRLSRVLAAGSDILRTRVSVLVRLAMVGVSVMVMVTSAMAVLRANAAGGPILLLLVWGIVFVLGCMALAVSGGAIQRPEPETSVLDARDRTRFGRFIEIIVGNPFMPVVSILGVIGFVIATFFYFAANNNGVEFFVESEPEQAIVYVQARGNLSLAEKDALLARAEKIVLAHPGVETVFAFAGEGGLNNNTGGAQPPADTIGQIQFETIPWEDRPNARALGSLFGFDFSYAAKALAFDGDTIIDDLTTELERLPGTRVEILAQSRGPASAKPVHLRLMSDDWDDLLVATRQARAQFEVTSGLTLIEDTLPLPGIDWQIDVDVEKAGRYGADVATVGAMVQLVTRGILLDTYTPNTSDDEIDIRVRLPEKDRVLSTLDTLKVRTAEGLVPLANFITRKPVAKLAEINRVGQSRYFDVKAGVAAGHVVLMSGSGAEAVLAGTARPITWDDTPSRAVLVTDAQERFEIVSTTGAVPADSLQPRLDGGDLRMVPMTPNERIAQLTDWLDTRPFAGAIDWEWTGDQEDEAESGAFLARAMLGALGLMFIILLAQFNSIYNSILVLLAVVLSTTGVLIGMLVMDQTFSIIMTGTGIVA